MPERATAAAGPPTVDRLDRQLLHALQIDGRAPFRRLAAVLGVSEQTVARRYRRMHEAGVVRVLGLPNPERTGQNWLLRIHVEPAAARPLAAALAKRADVSWIGLMAGGAEIACGVRTRSRDERDALLLDRLPRTSRVSGITTYAVMHRFAERHRADWGGFDDPLSDAQIAQLDAARSGAEHDAAPGSERHAADVTLSAADEPLLAALAEDGRVSYAELAARSGRSEAQVARRLDALIASRTLYIDIDIAADLLGYTTSAMLYLTVVPAQLHAVGELLAAHAECPFVAAVTGPVNLAASVLCTDLEHLYRYLTTRIGAIAAIHAVETIPVLERIKQAGSLMRGSLLAPPS